MTDDDKRIWQIVKKQPRTKAQWAALHDAIERDKRALIDAYKRAGSFPLVGTPKGESK